MVQIEDVEPGAWGVGGQPVTDDDLRKRGGNEQLGKKGAKTPLEDRFLTGIRQPEGAPANGAGTSARVITCLDLFTVPVALLVTFAGVPDQHHQHRCHR